MSDPCFFIFATVLCSMACFVSSQNNEGSIHSKLEAVKLDLWSRGAYDLDERILFGLDPMEQLQQMERHVALAPFRLGPVKRFLSNHKSQCQGGNCPIFRIRGGDMGNTRSLETKIQELGGSFGSEFLQAIEQNQREHEQDCYISCESYYCATADDTFSKNITEILSGGTEIRSYSMGSVPPEDFADQFGFPLDLIKVTGGIPLFSREEAEFIIKQAEAEGIEQNEYRSGKYKLGGDWLTNLPKTREWFNQILETKLFPLLCHLFPEVISSPSVLRAHSVSLLKYNSSHPRTDVHIDNGILAMTLAMTPRDQYVGGGTFFEHFDTVLPMDVGHVTLRPGSVRHGGHPVIEGTRYILGAFLLIKDRVEHVRRLKNRGSDLRKAGALEDAIRHFQWALALNPKCTTCLKDWAEILYAQGNFADAEVKLQLALSLLEEKDSDAFFSLGQVLSAQGRDDESIAAYTRSFQLNADDAELVYNLGIKLGERGDKEKENEMYAKATSINPTFGGAWLNWGTNLAEVGNFDDASLMFQKAMTCGPDVQPKAMINLAIIHHRTTSLKIDGGDYAGAKVEAKYASELLDNAKPLLDRLHQIGDTEAGHFLQQFKPLRLQCHRNLAQLYAGAGDFSGCEAELSAAVTNFPEEPMALHMLKRILDIQGKVKESEEISQRIAALTGSSTN